ncbi:WcaG Nucleoside-diphosphate-sugar epimerases [Rhabdaerophilaceae bacterium]
MLAAALLDRGESVRGLDIRPSRVSRGGFAEVLSSFDHRPSILEAMRGIKTVFHLGAFMSWVPQDQGRLFAANVEGTRVVLDAAIEAGVERFIFASSGEVYPEGAPEFLPVDEAHPTKPRSIYGLTKLLGEEMVRWAGRSHGLAITVLRFSHTQDANELLDPESFFSGPRFFLQPRIRQQTAMGNQAAAAVLRAVDDGTPSLVLARNEHGRPFRMMITDTRDMVSGLVCAWQSRAMIGETCNLGATDPVDFADAMPKMAKITGLPLRIVDLPGAGVFYETSNARIRALTGFEPSFSFDRMLKEAAIAWQAKQTS